MDWFPSLGQNVIVFTPFEGHCLKTYYDDIIRLSTLTAEQYPLRVA